MPLTIQPVATQIASTPPQAPQTIAGLPSSLMAQYKADPRLAVAQALRERSMSTEPIHHWVQGLARVAMAVSAGLREGNLQKEYLERGKAYQGAISAALEAGKTGGWEAMTGELAKSPYTSEMGLQMAIDQMGQDKWLTVPGDDYGFPGRPVQVSKNTGQVKPLGDAPPSGFTYGEGGGLQVDPAWEEYQLKKARAGKAEMNVDVDLPGKEAVNTIEKALIGNTESMAQVSFIASSWRREFNEIPTRVGMWGKSLQDKFGTLSESDQQALRDFAVYRQTAYAFLNAYINKLSGAAVSPDEAKRLIIGLPNPGTGLFDGDSPVEYKGKLDNTIRQLQYAQARLHYLKNQGFQSIENSTLPIEAMPRIIQRRGDEIRQDFIDLGFDDETARAKTRQQLSIEFGLAGM